MDRKKCCFFLLLCLALLSCGSRGAKSENPRDAKTAEIKEENAFSTLDTLKGLEMWLVPNKFKADDLDKKGKFIVRNNTEEKLYRGSLYTLERWNGNNWTVLPFKGIAFPDVLYHLFPQEDRSFGLCLTQCLAEKDIDRGKYRLAITVSRMLSQGHPLKLEDLPKVSAEFTVE